MIEHRDKCEKAEKRGRKKPEVTNYIGECFLKIANHLSYRPNFINYTFRDDMISDGIENCLQYMNNFNPEKSKNPFAYFTQIIYYAFIRRIQKEKKQIQIKSKLTMGRRALQNARNTIKLVTRPMATLRASAVPWELVSCAKKPRK